MKNKKLISLVILALIIALVVTALIINQTERYPSDKEIASINEIVNEIKTTNEILNIVENITEETNDIQENVILESDEKTTQEADTIQQESKISVKEPKQTSIVTQEKEVKSSKKSEPQNTAHITQKVTTQKQETQIPEQPKEEIKNKTEANTQNIETPKCSNTKHGIGVGNSNQWFETKNQAIALYDAEIKKWGDKWTNYEIDDETYYSNCPDGYEIWDCPYCHKWTINFYY